MSPQKHKPRIEPWTLSRQKWYGRFCQTVHSANNNQNNCPPISSFEGPSLRCYFAHKCNRNRKHISRITSCCNIAKCWNLRCDNDWPYKIQYYPAMRLVNMSSPPTYSYLLRAWIVQTKQDNLSKSLCNFTRDWTNWKIKLENSWPYLFIKLWQLPKPLDQATTN